MRNVHHSAQNKLRELQEKHHHLEESLLGMFDEVIQQVDSNDSDEAIGRQVRELLDTNGGADVIAEKFRRVQVYYQNNYLPLLWAAHANNRSVIFRVLDQLEIQSATQDQSPIRALHYIYSGCPVTESIGLPD